jgi:hypothetical protein
MRCHKEYNIPFSLCTRKAVEHGGNCTILRKVGKAVECGRNCTRLHNKVRKLHKIWAENAGLRTAQLA